MTNGHPRTIQTVKEYINKADDLNEPVDIHIHKIIDQLNEVPIGWELLRVVLLGQPLPRVCNHTELLNY